ncbi:MAG: hypothetical protein DRJ68_07005 [Thermoprotei archaeon]|nr:MAG: hypothetical protein DRJ68_07005 [Thermoprotei archaeon]
MQVIKGSSRPMGFTGFIVRGVVYEILKVIDKPLSESLHNLKRLAPFSTTPLKFEYSPNSSLSEGSIISFRISTLSDELSSKLTQYLIENAPDNISIRDAKAKLIELMASTVEPKKLLESSEPIEAFSVNFITPTFFRRSIATKCCPACPTPRTSCPLLKTQRRYRYVALPDPYLMFRGLARLWRKFADKHFNYKRYTEWLLDGGITVSGYTKLKTVRVYEHATTPKWSVGFKGKVYFNLPKDTYSIKMAKITHALLRFGEYSNVGGNRTAGFGVIKHRIKPKKEEEG